MTKLRSLADLGPGDHLCCIYETEEEHRAVVVPFLRQGLENGEKVLYIVDARTAETILRYLREDGLGVETYLQHGQLSILTHTETYTREGDFDPERMISLLSAETERTVAQGYPALRVTGEMTWALRGIPGSGRLIEYEARLNEFFPGSRCLAICQYDRRRFDPSLLLDVLRTHPIAVVGTEIYDNFHYIPPDDILGTDPSTAELQRWIRNLDQHKRAVQQLRLKASALEAAANGIAITDREGTIVWVNPAFTRLTGYTVEEAVGRNPRLLKSGQQDPAFYAELWETILAGEVWHGELVNQRKDGRLYIEEQTITPVRDEGGEIAHFVAIKQDVTTRRQAEEALQQYTERLENLHELERAILQAHSLETVAQAALRRIRQLLPCERASITTYDHDRNEARVVAADAPEGVGPPAGTRLDFEEFSQGFVSLEGLKAGSTFIGDLGEAEDLSPALERLASAGIRSVAIVPLIAGDELIGMLYVGATAPSAFDVPHLEIAEEVAGSLALAMHNVRLFQDAQQRARQLSLVADIVRQAVASLDTDTVLWNAARAIQSTFDYPDVVIFLVDRARGQLIRKAWAGRYPRDETPDLAKPIGEHGILDWVAVHGETVLANDVQRDPRYAAFYAGTAAELCVPLKDGETVIGGINVESEERGAFDQFDVLAMEAVADSLVVALRNARLFEETRQHVRRLTAMRNIDMAITASLDIRVTLNVILEQVTTQLEVDAATVLLLNEHTQTLEYAAGRGFRTDALQHTHLRVGEGYAGQAARNDAPSTFRTWPRPRTPSSAPCCWETRISSLTGGSRLLPKATSKGCSKSSTASHSTLTRSGRTSWKPWQRRQPSPSTTPNCSMICSARTSNWLWPTTRPWRAGPGRWNCVTWRRRVTPVASREWRCTWRGSWEWETRSWPTFSAARCYTISARWACRTASC